MSIFRKTAAAVLAAAALAPRVWGQAAPAGSELDQLKADVQKLKNEVQALRQASAQPSQEAVEWGGFGEMAYQNFSSLKQDGTASGARDQADLTRISLDAVFHLSQEVRGKVELEALHAGVFSSNNKGSLAVEQAWLEDRLTPALGLRAGLVVVPLGLVNEKHRPLDYHGVFRPSVETFIIPSTWRELGAGALGEFGRLSWRTYVVTGLSAAANPSESAAGFTGSAGLKGARSLGANSFAQKGAWAGRLDLKLPPAGFVGAAAYLGSADQKLIPAAVPVVLWEAHASLNFQGAELRALYAQGTIGNAALVNQAQAAANPAFKDFIGRKLYGGYASLAYNVFSLRPGWKLYLAPFLRFERYDTAAEVPAGFAASAATRRAEYTLGLDFRPAPRTVLKAEYQWLTNSAQTGVNEFNLGLGFDF